MKIFVDSAPFIYFVEGTDTIHAIVAGQFTAWMNAESTFETSVLTVTEVLVQPRKHNNLQRERAFRNLFTEVLDAPFIRIDERIAELAADYRSRHGYASIDALQLACAVASGCDIFYTNDHRLARFPHLRVVLVKKR